MAQGDTLTPDQFVEGCLDLTGPLTVTEDTRNQLMAHASKDGDLSTANQAEFSRRTAKCSR